ncbi:MAG: cache domain-containing protein [Fibromonadales bacterium]|nr:cache domain-containing protein [Fibromonadales bacterium]
MSFYKRIMLSMVAVLLLFALINGLLVYSIIKQSDGESVVQFNEILSDNEESYIESWLDFARSVIYSQVTLASRYPDSTDFYKKNVLDILRNGFYFIYDAKTGNAVLFRDEFGNILPQSETVLDMEDAGGKKFAKEIMEKARAKDTSYVTFTYSRPCLNCEPVERMARGIYIADWDWVVAKGSYTDKLRNSSAYFANKFNNSRWTLMGNLLGITFVSFLIGLLVIFRQMRSFAVPLYNLSTYIRSLATEGIRFEEFKVVATSPEIKSFAEDLNAVIKNVGSLIENVRISADKVSDLSGACKDMLNIVDYDAKLVGQRTVEMAVSSKDVIDNVGSMAMGIEEININLDGLKRLASDVAESTSDIKSSISKISNAMKELDEKSRNAQNSTDALELRDSIKSIVGSIAEMNLSLQYINSNIKLVSNDINDAYRNVDDVFTATDSMNERAKLVRAKMAEFSLKSKRVEEAHSAIEHTLTDAKDSMTTLNDVSANLRKVVDDLIRLDDKTQKIRAIQF